MKRILTVAIVVATCHFVTAKDLSAESLTVYNKIKLKLDKKEITLTEAQILWRKYRNSNGITYKAKIISESGKS